MSFDRTALIQLSDDDFLAVVNADVRFDRGGLPNETVASLRSPENVDRWHRTLLSLKRNVEAQMTSKRAELAVGYVEALDSGDLTGWLKERAVMLSWKQGACRFRNGLEDRIAEAKTIQENNALSFVTLREAVAAHRNAILTDPDNGDDADSELWKVLDPDDRVGEL